MSARTPFAKSWALAAVGTALAIAGCGGAASSSSHQSTSTTQAAQTPSPATQPPATTTQSPTTASATFSGQANVADESRYTYQVTYSLTLASASTDTTHDPPGFASIEMPFTSAAEASNTTPEGREAPGIGGMEFDVVYRANRPICRLLAERRAGGKMPLTSPRGDYCYLIASGGGSSDNPGPTTGTSTYTISRVPESRVPAIEADLSAGPDVYLLKTGDSAMDPAHGSKGLTTCGFDQGSDNFADYVIASRPEVACPSVAAFVRWMNLPGH